MKEAMRMRKRLIHDFILPALNENLYPGKLYWLNKEKGIFRIYWSHKNAAKWQSEHTIVFQDWDRLKGHYKPEGKNYFMSAKQRFRAALYKLSVYVTQLETGDKFYRDYQFHLNGGGLRKQSQNTLKPKAKGSKKANQCHIRPSVICENTSFVAKSTSEVQNQKSPSPPIKYISVQQTIEQYNEAMDIMHRRKQSNIIALNSNKPLKEQTTILKENTLTLRTPHIAPQQAPIYTGRKYDLHQQTMSINPEPLEFIRRKYDLHQQTLVSPEPPEYKGHKFDLHQQTIYVAPEIFTSQTYIEEPENLPQTKAGIQSSMHPTDNALNLSVKSANNDLPR